MQPCRFLLKRLRAALYNTGREAEWAKAAQFVRLAFLTRPWAELQRVARLLY